MDGFDKGCFIFFLVLIGLLAILAHAWHDTATMSKRRITASTLLQISVADAIVYGYAMAWLTDPSGPEKLIWDEYVDMGMRKCLPLNYSPRDAMQRLVNFGLLVYVVEAGKQPYYLVP